MENNMEKNEIVIIANHGEEKPLTIQEICEICHISKDALQEFISYEIIFPRQGLFDTEQLIRLHRARRLQRDLEMNLSGVAMVLKLLDEMQELRARIEFFEHYFIKEE
jgi:chaperone modulatory protein CbpM